MVLRTGHEAPRTDISALAGWRAYQEGSA
jgi:hypothetical protein